MKEKKTFPPQSNLIVNLHIHFKICKTIHFYTFFVCLAHLKSSSIRTEFRKEKKNLRIFFSIFKFKRIFMKRRRKKKQIFVSEQQIFMDFSNCKCVLLYVIHTFITIWKHFLIFLLFSAFFSFVAISFRQKELVRCGLKIYI